jgi:hypothetical protein
VKQVAVMEVAAMAIVAWAFDSGGDSLLWREKIANQYVNVIGRVARKIFLKRDY